MKAFRVCIVLAFWMSPASAVAADQPVIPTSVSFNDGWRFARFGPMPDGSTREEPGAARWSITVKASSEEAEQGEHGGAWPSTATRRRGGAPRVGG